ncbi:MAG TPA: TIGR03364 family FAD-dependent oxidoreductase [Chitinophagaceae bacterium]|nr:TIGR03364 family FAD-dependent oxidoreductase [Chitinophagaceae bacterium]
MPQQSAIVVGAGIVGLATARALGARGYRVTVLERAQRAMGASIRNFGMVWPIGQPDGPSYERAVRSRAIWKEVCEQSGIWCEEAGSLHLAYAPDEWRVLEELQEVYRDRGYQLLTAEQVLDKSPAVKGGGLIGGLYSPQELIVDPRAAIHDLPDWLSDRYGVQFVWGKAVTDIAYPSVYAGRQEWEADEIYVCSGADFETLYPERYAEQPLTKCKLQMMRMVAQPAGWRIGPALCGALSLAHYGSFRVAPSLGQLIKRFESQYPEYLKWGIHVMVSQNQAGELTIGDSHEYGSELDPFDRQFINNLILDYLDGFARFRNSLITETWNGIYPKLTNGDATLLLHPEQGVTILNGLGGAGMTLSFGFCEEVITGKPNG